MRFFSCAKMNYSRTSDCVEFGVLATVVINVAIFWDISPYSPYVYHVLEERITSIFWVKISRARNQRAAGV
jgi:hypothetical protein